ncbi:MAG: 2,5-diamino-6-(ribosylamino)-4(3H)-pyrimidinone 5'-phosphate reductase [Thermoplasmata archaeon]
MKGRPFVTLNMASTIDGRIALRGRKPLKLSSEEDFARVHRLRSECQAVLVGVETVIADDPKLTVKEELVPGASNPLRVILDSRGRLPTDSTVLDGTADTLVVTSEDCSETFEGAEVLRCGAERVDLHRLLRLLEERGVEKLLVEGGGTVAWSFLGSGLVDLLHVYIAPSVLGDSQAPSLFAGATASSVEDLVPMRLQEVTTLGGGVLLTFLPDMSGGPLKDEG